MNNKNTQPYFSVIIPTYNYARYIGPAIESVLHQNEDCEIIVVDDGSEDNTREVVEGYGTSVIYVHQNNRGVSAARNHGAHLASGQYLLFLDADDCILPGALQVIREQCERYPDVDCFIAGRTSIDKKGKNKTTIPIPLSDSNLENFTAFLHRKLGSVTIASIKKSAFNSVKFPESVRNNEDIVLTAQILACFSCKSIQQPVIEVHLHDDSLRHNVSSDMDSPHMVADALFNPEVLPEEFMRFKNEYYSRVLLSRFRSLYLAGEKTTARKLYHDAIAIFPKHLFLFSYLKKYLKSYF